MIYIKQKIIESGNCRCGSQEDAYYFFFKCKNYALARNIFFLILLHLDYFHIINSHLFSLGDESLSIDVNKQLFSLVQLYIKETGRFVLYSLRACFLYSSISRILLFCNTNSYYVMIVVRFAQPHRKNTIG